MFTDTPKQIRFDLHDDVDVYVKAVDLERFVRLYDVLGEDAIAAFEVRNLKP